METVSTGVQHTFNQKTNTTKWQHENHVLNENVRLTELHVNMRWKLCQFQINGVDSFLLRFYTVIRDRDDACMWLNYHSSFYWTISSSQPWHLSKFHSSVELSLLEPDDLQVLEPIMILVRKNSDINLSANTQIIFAMIPQTSLSDTYENNM